jgi:hypothetical protein
MYDKETEIENTMIDVAAFSMGSYFFCNLITILENVCGVRAARSEIPM